MLFDISSAPEVLQRKMHKLIEGLDGHQSSGGRFCCGGDRKHLEGGHSRAK